ncbi:hypothetical protein VTL71DRAFT_2225 [Oculimacula yallundae]|uniref:Uncharacterized protein n=1 Tax=Oculimacula yallundae TaxID=86028 RepID=A0ABR4CA98_9HELO
MGHVYGPNITRVVEPASVAIKISSLLEDSRYRIANVEISELFTGISDRYVASDLFARYIAEEKLVYESVNWPIRPLSSPSISQATITGQWGLKRMEERRTEEEAGSQDLRCGETLNSGMADDNLRLLDSRVSLITQSLNIKIDNSHLT